MPQVDFYVLEKVSDAAARHQFVGRLANKLRKLGNPIVILTNDPAHTQALDAALWAFPPEAFLPHDTDLAPSTNAPILITAAESVPAATTNTVVINLREQPPHNHAQLHRLVEVVLDDAANLELSRQHWAFYRNLGYPLQSHPIAHQSKPGQGRYDG